MTFPKRVSYASAKRRELVSQDWRSLGSSETRRASLLAELGEKEKAIAFLNDGAARGDFRLFSMKYDPAFDSLRGDPRFQAVLNTAWSCVVPLGQQC